jgi:hypothetical protein
MSLGNLSKIPYILDLKKNYYTLKLNFFNFKLNSLSIFNILNFYERIYLDISLNLYLENTKFDIHKSLNNLKQKINHIEGKFIFNCHKKCSQETDK